MSDSTLSPWIKLNPKDIVQAASLKGVDDGLQWAPSPYDVPTAVRVDEGDPSNSDYIVEMKYLGGDERTKRESLADFVIESGTNSGRVYRVTVKGIDAATRPDGYLLILASKFSDPSQQPGNQLRTFNSKAKWALVSKALKAAAGELADQLNHSGKAGDNKSIPHHRFVGTSSRF